MSSTQWLPPPDKLVLAQDEVHVWRASLDVSVMYQEHLWQVLSRDEQARAKQFRFEKHRRHFIAGRGLLRVLLGRYLNVEPERLQFAYGANGKPFLVDGDDDIDIQFNISHSQSLALYAFVRNNALGIDIEYMRPFPDAEQIVNRFFSLREKDLFHALPAEKKNEAFFSGWTRKEAYLKACGDGLMYPLSQVEVTLKSDEPARILSIGGDKQKAAQWFLLNIVAAPDYKAALAMEGQRQWQVKMWQWVEL